MRIEDFVRHRLEDQNVPDAIARTIDRLLSLSDRIRDDGNTNDALSWLTGTAPAKIGEYIFGADPASDAERISDELHGILAATWEDHPDFNPDWALPARP